MPPSEKIASHEHVDVAHTCTHMHTWHLKAIFERTNAVILPDAVIWRAAAAELIVFNF